MRLARLRATGTQLVQTAAAAGLAWLVAHDLLGHANAFFAPVAAVIVLGVVPGNHIRRAVEIVLGVGLGIAVGDLLVSAIGRGAWQVALVVLLAMSAAVMLGGGALVVSQAGGSAVLVATLTVPGGFVPTRFVDALVGGVVGLAVLAIAPRDPAKLLERAAAPVFDELAAVLDDIAAALAARDVEATTAALVGARRLDSLADGFREKVQLATETVRLAPLRRHERGRVERYATALTHVGYAIRNTRVLARAALRAVELEPSIPAPLVESIRDVALAVRRLGTALETGSGAAEVEASARRAAVAATLSLDEGMGFALGVLVGQVRSIAADLLRSLGLERADAVGRLRTAADLAEREHHDVM